MDRDPTIPALSLTTGVFFSFKRKGRNELTLTHCLWAWGLFTHILECNIRIRPISQRLKGAHDPWKFLVDFENVRKFSTVLQQSISSTEQ